MTPPITEPVEMHIEESAAGIGESHALFPAGTNGHGEKWRAQQELNPPKSAQFPNLTHRNFLGLQTVEDIVGKTDADFYPRELAERIRADDQVALEAKVSVLNREEQFTNHRGEKILVSTSKVPYRDEQGKIVGLVCTGRILSERK